MQAQDRPWSRQATGPVLVLSEPWWYGGDGWPAVVDTPRPPSPWLAELQLAQLSPGDLSTVAGFWEARWRCFDARCYALAAVSFGGHEPEQRASRDSRSVEGLNAKECIDGWA